MAQLVGTDVSSVKRWRRAWRAGGDAALRSKPIPGRPSELSAVERHRLAQIVRAGPLQAGFATDWWTCKRVAEVIHREFDVTYHPDHVGRLLHALGFHATEAAASRFSTQRSGDCAVANRRLAADQKTARRRGATVEFLDETGFLLQPVTRRTWAPRGQTPIQRVSDWLSAIGVISLAPRRRAIGVRWMFHDDDIRARDVVAFVRHLDARIRRPLVVVLDRFNVHRSAAVRQLQERRTPWFDVEWLPAYAPDLNPVEALWSCTKHGDLANYAPDDLFDLGDAVVNALFRQRRDRRIKRSYFQTAQLNL